MADDAREFVKAAQEAELRGDKAQAKACLTQAIALYRERGSEARAEQLVRYAERLEPVPASPKASEKRADFVERGPTLLGADVSAWCSFCCRPGSEVGALVAGPAGAFICTACTQEAGLVLKVPPVPLAPRLPAAPLDFNVVGQSWVEGWLAKAAGRGLFRVLLLGPAGCGKTCLLNQVATRGEGRWADLARLEPAPSGQWLLVDALEQRGDAEVKALEHFLGQHPDARVLCATRSAGSLSAHGLLQEGEEQLPWYTSAQLKARCAVPLPDRLTEALQLVLPFRPLDLPSWEALAQALWAGLSRKDALPPPLMRALCEEAARAERGGHELKASLARIPEGQWQLLEAP